jgi:ketosteroid isomerase-like protein
MSNTISATTPAEANGILIKNAYDAFSRGDVATVFATFADDILWHVPGRGSLAGDYRGHDQVRGFFDRFMTLSNGTFRLKVDRVLAKDDCVVVLCTTSAQRGGRSWASPQVHVWTVRNGKATVFWEYQGDQQTEDEFWGS